jgi:3-oxoacyl-[acyl-carrier protein] reductase
MGRHRIRVNAVCPGLIQTQMSAAFVAGAGKALLSQVPLGRLGTPEDVAPLVRFLASEGAAYMSGQVIAVDGGLV